MRKSVGLGIGLASVAILAVAGIASANAATGSGTVPPSRQSATSTVISQADAERIAQAAVPDSTVRQSRLDTDNGRTVWNVHLSTPTGDLEVKVDAQTGAVRVDDDQAGAGATATSDDNDGDDDAGPNHDGTDDHGNDSAGHSTNDDHGTGGSNHDGSGHN